MLVRHLKTITATLAIMATFVVGSWVTDTREASAQINMSKLFYDSRVLKCQPVRRVRSSHLKGDEMKRLLKTTAERWGNC